MRKLLLVTALAVGAVNADIIPNLVVGPGGVTCELDPVLLTNVCTFNYSATLHDEAKLAGASAEPQFFTIYDFNGYVPGSAVAPAGWQFSTAGTGPTPDLIAIGLRDNAAIPNLTFTYVGGADVTGGATFTGFSAESFFGPGTSLDWYAAQAQKQGDAPGTQTQDVGRILVPVAPAGEPGEIPEPMTMALLGGGLIGLGLLPRRFKK